MADEYNEKECIECGKLFKIKHGENRRLCCSIECKIAHQKKTDAERYARKKQTRYDHQVEKWDKPKPKKKSGKYHGPSIAQIQQEAREHRMSYGQYVAKMGL